jgi:hypothetical protein
MKLLPWDFISERRSCRYEFRDSLAALLKEKALFLLREQSSVM